MIRSNTYLADRYFNMLKPLDADTKLQIVSMLVNSIEIEKKEKTRPIKSVFDLYGVWADNPDADDIEATIREGRNDPHYRHTASLE